MEKSVPLRVIAERLGLSRSAARKLVLRQGLEFHRKIDPQHGNQRVVCLYENEVDRLTAERQSMML